MSVVSETKLKGIISVLKSSACFKFETAYNRPYHGFEPDDFPNLYTLLKITATLPVTTCEYERSISAMRSLNNYMRCNMGESRLSSLAPMHIKYNMPFNLDEIVNLFESLHPRMMQFTSLMYDYQQIE